MFEWLKGFANKAAEGFSSKTGETILDGVIGKGGSIFDFPTKVKNLEQDLAWLRSLADDTKNEVKNEELKGRKKRKREVKEWLTAEAEIQGRFHSLKDEIDKNKFSRIWCVDHVEKLNKRVKKHIEDRKHFRELVLDHHERSNEKFLGDMYGAAFRATSERIVDCLKARNVRMIGIYGGKKAGKTTLAKHIHNKVIEETQDHVYWVVVSANLSTKTLQEDISRAIGLNLSDVNDVAKRAARLHQALMQRKDFVLILDGLRSYIDLQEVGCVLKEDGCRLIITTPSLRVCQRQHVDSQRTFEVKMDEDEAWNIFKEAYGRNPIFSTHQEEFFKEEVNKRRGFPQKIINFARDPEAEDSEFSD